MTNETASLAIMLQTLAQLFGVGIGAWIGDRYNKRHLAALCMLGHMAGLLAQLERIVHLTGCTILFLHHSSKAAAMQGQGDVLRRTRNMVFLQGLVTVDGTPALRVSGISKQGPLIGDGTDSDPLKLRAP